MYIEMPEFTILNIGDSIKLNSTITPDNASNKGVFWSSRTPSIASVNQQGQVTSHKAGAVTQRNRFSR